MPNFISATLAQENFLLGDINANLQKILADCKQAKAQGMELIVFSELSLIGYPPSDLLLSPSLPNAIEQALQTIEQASQQIAIVLGFPWFEQGQCFNAAAFYADGQCLARYHKRLLANDFAYAEPYYFSAGQQPCVVDYNDQRFALLLGEESANEHLMQEAKQMGADFIINPTAEAFIQQHNQALLSTRQQLCKQYQLPLLLANYCAGQDEALFAGGSYVLNAQGEISHQLPYWQTQLACDVLNTTALPESAASISQLYQALVFGLREYATKNRFNKAILGLSGGIDSALTLAIAVDALGASNVRAVMMPFTYTADISKADAAKQAELMAVEYLSLSIEPIYQAFMTQLADDFADSPVDLTEQNLQARCRGTLLMALSNKHGELVLTTSNKSETAVGYSTLYGDMAGGFAALKDVYKTQVYQLARYRNSISPVIPERVITREPSAELAPDQKDQDNLPAYDQLDGILQRYIEQRQSAQQIIEAGFAPADVSRVLRLVDLNEYKRRQAPTGLRLTRQGFGRERNFPMTGLKHR